jgi:hypothetical protein
VSSEKLRSQEPESRSQEDLESDARRVGMNGCKLLTRVSRREKLPAQGRLRSPGFWLLSCSLLNDRPRDLYDTRDAGPVRVLEDRGKGNRDVW